MVRLTCGGPAQRAPRTPGRRRRAPGPASPAAAPGSLLLPPVPARSPRGRAAPTRDRASSGRVEAARATNPPPRSRPTRSAGPSRRSSCAASHAAYSPAAAPDPSGRAPPNPGSGRTPLPGRPSAASRPPQTAGVSGTPWTKTAVTAPHRHSGEGSPRGNDANHCPKAPALWRPGSRAHFPGERGAAAYRAGPVERGAEIVPGPETTEFPAPRGTPSRPARPRLRPAAPSPTVRHQQPES